MSGQVTEDLLVVDPLEAVGESIVLGVSSDSFMGVLNGELFKKKSTPLKFLNEKTDLLLKIRQRLKSPKS